MITLLTGKKGSGKTKKLIDLVHGAVGTSLGNVVCVEKGDTLTYDVDHKARLVNIESYGIVGFEGLYGFIAGLCAGNYDITDIFVDSTLKIGGRDLNDLLVFLVKTKTMTDGANVNITFSVSADSSEFPEAIFKIAEVK
ncbi:MAG: hypothetical protein IIY93_11780 [Clostridia bacterium]|nr:hypothetical protein [Clostridia bacterium]MBQ1554288.1 hypothetical protein [Clostridia bacterium]MBQ5544647.1 hypothetical protein [Clostridia bacterium]